MLVYSGRVQFTSLEQIKASYQKLFDVQFSSPIADIFGQFPLTRSIENIRHSFAHRTGYADLTSVNAIGDFSGLHGISEGEKIILTGPMVRDSINIIIEVFMALFGFGVRWLNENADECRRRGERRAAFRDRI